MDIVEPFKDIFLSPHFKIVTVYIVINYIVQNNYYSSLTVRDRKLKF